LSARARAAALALATAGLLAAAAPVGAELVQEDGVRVSVQGALSPTKLPRRGTAPITVTVGGRISSAGKDAPPQLQEVSFGFNRAGRIDTRGLAMCRLGHIDPSTTAEALAACGSALVGTGTFSANVRFPEQSPFPSRGKVLAFNGKLRGRPVVFAHIYGTEPVPTSYVLPLEIERGKGTFATRMHASLPRVTGEWGHVTGLTLKLGRTYVARGRRHSFLSAGCPAPPGFPGALFQLTRTRFEFEGGTSVTATLTRSCKAKG
jgi:hypothetical protein